MELPSSDLVTEQKAKGTGKKMKYALDDHDFILPNHIGKWTLAEEIYADTLIHHFMDGSLTDCEEGTTLRSYIADKLKCQPIRITKKYSGSKYTGKVNYPYFKKQVL